MHLYVSAYLLSLLGFLMDVLSDVAAIVGCCKSHNLILLLSWSFCSSWISRLEVRRSSSVLDGFGQELQASSLTFETEPIKADFRPLEPRAQK